MGMGSGGVAIIEMQRQQKAFAEGRMPHDTSSGAVYLLGTYAFFAAAGTVGALFGAGLLVLAVIVQIRQEHRGFVILSDDPHIAAQETPWKLWATVVSSVVVTTQLMGYVFIVELVDGRLGAHSDVASCLMAVVPALVVYVVLTAVAGPQTLSRLGRLGRDTP